MAARTADPDKSAAEARSEALIYTTEPLERPLTLTGEPELELWLSASAESTDLSARLC